MWISTYLDLTDDADIPLESLLRFLRTESFTQTSPAKIPGPAVSQSDIDIRNHPWREEKP
jgi:hypothetical protein